MKQDNMLTREDIINSTKIEISQNIYLQRMNKILLFIENHNNGDDVYTLPTSRDSILYSNYFFEEVLLQKVKEEKTFEYTVKNLMTYMFDHTYNRLIKFFNKKVKLKNIKIDKSKNLYSNVFTNIIENKDVFFFFLISFVYYHEPLINESISFEKNDVFVDENGEEFAEMFQTNTENDALELDIFNMMEEVEEFINIFVDFRKIIKRKRQKNDVIYDIKTKITFEQYKDPLKYINDNFEVNEKNIKELFELIVNDTKILIKKTLVLEKINKINEL